MDGYADKAERIRVYYKDHLWWMDAVDANGAYTEDPVYSSTDLEGLLELHESFVDDCRTNGLLGAEATLPLPAVIRTKEGLDAAESGTKWMDRDGRILTKDFDGSWGRRNGAGDRVELGASEIAGMHAYEINRSRFFPMVQIP